MSLFDNGYPSVAVACEHHGFSVKVVDDGVIVRVSNHPDDGRPLIDIDGLALIAMTRAALAADAVLMAADKEGAKDEQGTA